MFKKIDWGFVGRWVMLGALVACFMLMGGELFLSALGRYIEHGVDAVYFVDQLVWLVSMVAVALGLSLDMSMYEGIDEKGAENG